MATAVTDEPEDRRYVVRVDGQQAGFAEYELQDSSTIAFTHTEIGPDFGGQGLGGTLIGHALDDVRERGLAVLPHCSFVRGFIAKSDGYLDLVPADQRARFDLPAAG